jgi:hypothetical protein
VLISKNYSALVYSLRHVLLSVSIFLGGEMVSAQLSLSNLDYTRIPQKKIISFVEEQKKTGRELFSEFIPKCFREQDSARYHKISTSYIIRGKADDVWNEYLSIQPSQAYCGKIVDFGFLYSKDDDRILYKEDIFDKMKVGQLFFFNVKLLGGIRNLGIADEVTTIDNNLKLIRFCYIENGKTEGTQEIQLKNTDDGYTSVTHDTWYKSNSRFRDSMLYPFFHKRSVDEFHHAVREVFEKDEALMLSGSCTEK